MTRHCRLAIAMMAAVLVSAGALPAHAKQTVEVAFVLDTTGSMGALIEGAKKKIWSIATSIFDANPDAEVRIGLVAYRDIGDDYVTKRFDLTTDIQDLYAKLLGLRAQGGGDWPESVNEALDVAVNKLSWTRGTEACRIMFLVGDAPPHMDYAQDTKYPQTIQVARQKDIIVNTVLAGTARDTERVWREIAQRGNGNFIPIPQDGGEVVVIETPYDDDIIILQKSINKTVMPYGPAPMQRQVVDKARQVDAVAAAAPASASDMASFINKRAKTSNEAVTGEGDLVTDYTSGRQKLDAIKDDELPPAIRALPKPERPAALEQQATQRKELNAKLADLVARRDAYIAKQRGKQQPKANGSFDEAVAATLKAQIK
jgi:VWA domain-containing protein